MDPLTASSIDALTNALKWGVLGYALVTIVLNIAIVTLILRWAEKAHQNQLDKMAEVYNNIIKLQEEKNTSLNQMVVAMNGTLGSIYEGLHNIERACPFPRTSSPGGGGS